MLTYGLLAVLVISCLACGIGVFRLAEREKRFPSPMFMLELIGRWWSLPRERADPFVSVAVGGFALFLVSWITLLFGL